MIIVPVITASYNSEPGGQADIKLLLGRMATYLTFL